MFGIKLSLETQVLHTICFKCWISLPINGHGEMDGDNPNFCSCYKTTVWFAASPLIIGNLSCVCWGCETCCYCSSCVMLLQLQVVPGGHPKVCCKYKVYVGIVQLVLSSSVWPWYRQISCPGVPDVHSCVCYFSEHPHFSLDPAAALVSSFLVPHQFPSLLLYLVVHSAPVTCLLKSICFLVLLDTLLPLIPVQVFVFGYVFLLILVVG